MYAKKTKTLKTLVVVLSVILLMCLTVAGTLAYLQVQTGSVQNTFAPSNIDLKLEESNADGGSDTTNAYKMIPGVDIAKDPKVTVTADIDSYVFVKVVESANFDTYMTYAIESGWTKLDGVDGVYYRAVSATVDEDSNSNNHVEAFYVLAGSTAYPNGVVQVPNTVSKTAMNALYNTDGTVKTDSQPTLTFTAYAIQQAGFDTVKDAWTQAQAQQ